MIVKTIARLYKKDVIRDYTYIKKLAIDAFERKNNKKCLHYVQLCAQAAYQFNWIYADEELEKLLENISNILISPAPNYKPIENRFVFYDSFSTDNRALTQQYIRALNTVNCELLYITELSKDRKQGKDIFKELNSFNKVEIWEVPQNIEKEKQIKMICNKIISYAPEKLFIHVHPWSVNAIVAFYALPKEIVKYKINLTDHAFWLGSKCLDFSIEFRSRGCTLSREMRNIKEERLLLLPYYPISNEMPFNGFPEECTPDKVIIFSGASVYKVYGKNWEFFKLVKQLLDENPDTVFLFAGAGNMEPMKKFINSNKLEKRFLMIGNRTDIGEVFRHCDIYMGTFPNGGGLMSQLAAYYEKPIIAYTTPELDGMVEQFVCHNNFTSITYMDKKGFFEEAKRLVENENYRKQKGKELKACLITRQQFEMAFANTIKTNTSIYPIEHAETNHNARFDLYLELENNFQFDYKRLIINNFKLRTAYLFPKIFLWFLIYFITKQDWKMVQRKMRGVS